MWDRRHDRLHYHEQPGGVDLPWNAAQTDRICHWIRNSLGSYSGAPGRKSVRAGAIEMFFPAPARGGRGARRLRPGSGRRHGAGVFELGPACPPAQTGTESPRACRGPPPRCPRRQDKPCASRADTCCEDDWDGDDDGDLLAGQIYPVTGFSSDLQPNWVTAENES